MNKTRIPFQSSCWQQVILVAFLSLLLTAPQQPACGSERVALVMGNGAYRHGAPLQNPVNDAKAVGAALNKAGFDVALALDSDLSTFEQHLLNFQRAAQSAEAAWFYYAGHGVEVKGVNYLVPVDADVQQEFQVKHKTLSLDMVLGALDEAGTPLKVVVLDCCRDNPFGRGWTRSQSKGLGQVSSTPSGTIIAFAAAPGKTAEDGLGATNSPYTTALLQSIKTPGLEIDQIFKETGRLVLATTGKNQQPWINSSFYDSFVLTPASRESNTASSAPSTPLPTPQPSPIPAPAPVPEPTASPATGTPPSHTLNPREHPRVILETSKGSIELELRPDKAPLSCANFLNYVKKGHYDGTIFHRVIPGFMAQGGGFTPNMIQNPRGAPIKNEATNGLKNNRGSIAMARTREPDSADCQFFINVVDNSNLDYPSFDGFGYAVFGHVTKGMEVVDIIVNVPRGASNGHNDVPLEPVIIKSVRLE